MSKYIKSKFKYLINGKELAPPRDWAEGVEFEAEFDTRLPRKKKKALKKALFYSLNMAPIAANWAAKIVRDYIK